MAKHKITLLPGDGIGPEVTAAVVQIIECAGVDVEWEKYFVGAEALARFGDPLPQEVLDSILRNKVALKGPVTTPVGTGFASINVRLRKTLDLYANLRPVQSLPNIITRYEDIDLIVVRENTESLYAGLEHEVVPGVVESLKIITEKASTRIARVRLRVRAHARPQARHGRAQGQHHEALGRPVPAVLPQRRRGLPEHRGRRQDRRQPLHAARHRPEPVRHPAAREPLRRHRLRSDRRTRRRTGSRRRREHRRERRGLRGRARQRARHRRTEQRQSARAAAVGGADAPAHRRDRPGASASTTRSLKVLGMGPELRTRDIGGTGSTTDFTSAICDVLRKGTRAATEDQCSVTADWGRAASESTSADREHIDPPQLALSSKASRSSTRIGSGTRTRRGKRSGSRPRATRSVSAGADPARGGVSPRAARNVSRRRAAVRRRACGSLRAVSGRPVGSVIDRDESAGRGGGRDHRGTASWARKRYRRPEEFPKLALQLSPLSHPNGNLTHRGENAGNRSTGPGAAGRSAG